jgi:hypothetical protein
MRNRAGQLDVTHPLPAYLGVSHFHTAAVTDHTLVADALELTAVTFPLFGGTKDSFAEQTVLSGRRVR